jgi:integrase
VRHHIGALARLAQTLRMRPDRGEVAAALGRVDMETFLHRLAHQESSGQISTDARVRARCEVRAVLARIRAMGLSRPGGLAAGLGEDFTLGVTDIPCEPEPAECGRDLPAQVIRAICEHLPELTSPEMRTAIEVAINTGRRREEIAALAFDCLARDDDGLAVLVYDNHKGQAARGAPADQRAHRRVDRHPAAACPRPLPPHPARRPETAAIRPTKPGRREGDHRVQPGLPPPHLDQPDPRPPHQRRR